MNVLITYDVNVTEENGAKRLRRVAKVCVNYGQRVQNSVFECELTPAMYIDIKEQLLKIIDKEKDTIRFYNLGKNWQSRVEKIGRDESYDPRKDTFVI